MARAFTAEEYVSLKSPDCPAVTPDGDACVFAVVEADLEESRVVSHLWLADGEGGDARQITFSHEGEENPSFSPDGAWLAFLSARPDYGRPEPELDEGEDPRVQLWAMPAGGGEARCLTDQREGVRDFDWLPDSSGLVYLAQEPRPKALQTHHSRRIESRADPIVEHEDRRRIGLWRIEVDEEGENRRIWQGDPGGISVAVSPDGARAVYATNYTGDPNDYGRTDLWMVDLSSGAARQLTHRPGAEWAPQWSPNGDRIAFLATVDPDLSYSQAQLWTVPADGGEPSRMVHGLDREIDSYFWPRLARDTLLFTAAEDLAQPLYRLRISTGQIERLTPADGVCGGFGASDDGETVYLVWETGSSWPDVCRLPALPAPAGTRGRPAGAARRARAPLREDLSRMSDLNPEWREVALGPQRAFRWASDDLEIDGLLVTPRDPPVEGPLPLVVYVHGGPHGSTKDSLRQGIPLQWLAQHGYAVLAPNYRGSDHRGAEFAVANRRDLGGGDFRDVMAGVDAAIAAGIADPARLAIMGGSYGGYMTNWAISQTDRFRAAVSLFGVFNWVTDFSNSEVSHFEKEYFDAYYWEDATLYFERSPFRYVDRIRTPVLIMHGESDPNTVVTNSREMYQALRALGRTATFVRYPREGHGFHEPHHRIDELRRILDWFDTYLLGDGPAQPVAYRAGHDVPGEDGWTLHAIGAETVSPAGHKEPSDSRLVQVTFVLASESRNARFGLRLQTVELEAASGPCAFAGAPLSVLDETVLLTGPDLGIAVHQEEPPAAFPVSAVFRVPKGEVDLILRVPGFAPVIVPLPPGDRDDEAD